MKKKLLTLTAIFVLLINNTTCIDAKQTYNAYINEIADMYGICPELIQSVIFHESNFNPNCVSDHGAIGLMQVIPKYNKERIERLGVTDIYDPYSNILVGTDLIYELSLKYDVYEALVAYNCGENSKTLEYVRNGGRWDYADNILKYSEELERKNNK